MNRKRTNAWLWLLLPFLLLLQTTFVQAASLPSIPTDNYFDQVNLLNSQTQDLVSTKNQQYAETKDKPQIMLAVVKSTGDSDVDQYAADLFSKWGIGQKKLDNGILILYALNDGQRNVRVEVGYGLEDVVTDSQAGQILASNKSQLKSTSTETVNQGLQKTFSSITTLVDRHYGYKNDRKSDKGYQNRMNSNRSIFNVKNILQLVGLIIVIGFMFSPWGRSWQLWSILAWLFNNNDHFGGFGGGGSSSGGGSSGGGGASI